MTDASTVLVRLSGRDQPGITAGLLDVLSADDAEILDMEQFVVRGRLTLDVVVSFPTGAAALKELLYYGWERGLDVDFEIVEGDEHDLLAERFMVTVITPRLTATALHAVADAIVSGGSNIERIVRMARYPVMAYRLELSGGDLGKLQTGLALAARMHGVDTSLQEQRLEHRSMRLVVMDVDSTLVQAEVIDELAAVCGHGDEVAAITAQAMDGNIGFEAALRSRVALLEGLEESKLEEVAASIRLTPGARTFVRTLQRLGFKTAIVSGGFTYFTDRLARELGLDHAFANTLEIVDGRLTGRLVGRLIDRAAKQQILEQVAELEGIPLEQTVAIGDGANDADMLAAAGLGIAFNARQAAQEAADTAVSVPFLDAILFLLGVSRDEVERADRRVT